MLTKPLLPPGAWRLAGFPAWEQLGLEPSGLHVGLEGLAGPVPTVAVLSHSPSVT